MIILLKETYYKFSVVPFYKEEPIKTLNNVLSKGTLLTGPVFDTYSNERCRHTVSVLCCALKGSRRSDEEALEEQVRKLGEELREVRELYEAEQEKTRSNDEELLQLHNQVPTSETAH